MPTEYTAWPPSCCTVPICYIGIPSWCPADGRHPQVLRTKVFSVFTYTTTCWRNTACYASQTMQECATCESPGLPPRGSPSRGSAQSSSNRTVHRIAYYAHATRSACTGPCLYRVRIRNTTSFAEEAWSHPTPNSFAHLPPFNSQTSPGCSTLVVLSTTTSLLCGMCCLRLCMKSTTDAQSSWCCVFISLLTELQGLETICGPSRLSCRVTDKPQHFL